MQGKYFWSKEYESLRGWSGGRQRVLKGGVSRFDRGL